MFCTQCGSKVEEGARFCPQCGAKLHGEEACGEEMGTEEFNWQPPEPVSRPLLLCSVFIPLVGIVMGLIKFSDGEKRAGKTYLLCGVGAWIFWMLWMVLF
ncbi:MAG: zinc-ribbon domain-containing protein [Pygmaiobacter massiliensis]|nr:zinc-ribbon domain-containing protein [Pygmaiobacter massiliensis]